MHLFGITTYKKAEKLMPRAYSVYSYKARESIIKKRCVKKKPLFVYGRVLLSL